MTPKQRREYWQNYESIRLEVEARGRRKFLALLSRQTLAVIRAARESGVQAAADSIDSLIKYSDTQATIQAFYIKEGLPFARREYEIIGGIKSHYADLRLKRRPVVWVASLFSEAWQKMLSDYVIINAARKVVAITDTTKRLIRGVLKNALDQNLNVRQTAKLIKDKMSGFNRNRVLNIARTETATAANYAATIGAESAAKQLTGARLEKFWIATSDSRTRDAHRAMIGSAPIPIESFFYVGGEKMKHPGDPNASAKNVCNCRCVVAHRVVRE